MLLGLCKGPEKFKSLRRWLGVSLLVGLTSCAPVDPHQDLADAQNELASMSRTSNIVGGQKLDLSQKLSAMQIQMISSTVALYYDDGVSQSICSAVIIADKIVLTAAHCVKDLAKKYFKVVFSTDTFYSLRHRPDQWTGVEDIIIHKDFVSPESIRAANIVGSANDLALVKMETRPPANYRVATWRSTEVLPKENLWVLGYGVTTGNYDSGVSDISKLVGILRITQVPVIERRTSRHDILLQQEQGRGICHGDSGGPVFKDMSGKEISGKQTSEQTSGQTSDQMVLVGISSAIMAENMSWDQCMDRSMVTDLSAYTEWIQSQINNLQKQDQQNIQLIRLKQKMEVRN